MKRIVISVLVYFVWAFTSLSLLTAATPISWAQTNTPVAFAQAVGDLNLLLQEIEQAAHSVDYSGSYTLSNGGQVEDLQTISVQDGLGLKQRTISSAYPGVELIRQNQDWYELLPQAQLAYAVSSMPTLFPAVLTKANDLNKYYRGFQINEAKPLADRLCIPYSVISIEADRPNWYFCVDTENSLLLERHVIDPSKRFMVYTRFNEVRFGADVDVAQASPSVEMTSLLVKTPERVSVNLQKSGWRFSFPDGFEILSSQQLGTGTSPSTIQLVLSDGLSVFSIFIQKLSEQEKLLSIEPMMQLHSTSMYAHRIDDYMVMVTGMMPMKTLKEVASSATFIPPVVNQ